MLEFCVMTPHQAIIAQPCVSRIGARQLLDFLNFSESVAHPAIVGTGITNSSQDIASVVLQMSCIKGSQPESLV